MLSVVKSQKAMIICSKRPPMDATVRHRVCIANSSLRNESDELYRIHVTYLSPPPQIMRIHVHFVQVCDVPSCARPANAFSLSPFLSYMLRLQPIVAHPRCHATNQFDPFPFTTMFPSSSHHTDRLLHTAHVVCGPSQVLVSPMLYVSFLACFPSLFVFNFTRT
jgi:hypothetical protein